jgi:hypothetical protein
MTAEIAILNKSAVALAADSAVTIGQPPNAKIYKTVNKIFELSNVAPVGIMVYGRLDHMGLPLEVIVKEYRKYLIDKTFGHVEAYRDGFSDLLGQRNTLHVAGRQAKRLASLAFGFLAGLDDCRPPDHGGHGGAEGVQAESVERHTATLRERRDS